MVGLQGVLLQPKHGACGLAQSTQCLLYTLSTYPARLRPKAFARYTLIKSLIMYYLSDGIKPKHQVLAPTITLDQTKA
jgi:hypothetical protein